MASKKGALVDLDMLQTQRFGSECKIPHLSETIAALKAALALPVMVQKKFASPSCPPSRLSDEGLVGARAGPRGSKLRMRNTGRRASTRDRERENRERETCVSSICIYTYIYIFTERERTRPLKRGRNREAEREGEREGGRERERERERESERARERERERERESERERERLSTEIATCR